MEETDLDREAARVRECGVVGTGGTLLQLFDFLVAASRAGTPKEIDIATTVFGKPDTIDFAQDATVRVYIHRLRRKLDEFYATEGGRVRLDIPRGSYRLVAVARAVEETTTDKQPPAAVPTPWRRPRRRWVLALAAAIVAVNLVIWLVIWPRSTAPTIDAVRAREPWASLLRNGRPTAIVVGDYYIFGEIDRERGVDRMVRDYGVNSRSDLDELLMEHPRFRPSYVDLDLTYLPAATAQALRDLMPILARTDAERARTRIVLASNLGPATLKIANIVYVGYFSGLGPLLRNPVFAGSRFAVGATWDELVDGGTGRHYHSDQGGPGQPGTTRDFAYVSAFAGTEGNRYVVVTGTRDAAVMQAAAMASTPAALDVRRARTGDADAYEALYEVEGLDRVNMGGKLVVAAPLAADRIWRATDKTFPGK